MAPSVWPETTGLTGSRSCDNWPVLHIHLISQSFILQEMPFEHMLGQYQGNCGDQRQGSCSHDLTIPLPTLLYFTEKIEQSGVGTSFSAPHLPHARIHALVPASVLLLWMNVPQGPRPASPPAPALPCPPGCSGTLLQPLPFLSCNSSLSLFIVSLLTVEDHTVISSTQIYLLLTPLPSPEGRPNALLFRAKLLR